jgi:hypothetical protein
LRRLIGERERLAEEMADVEEEIREERGTLETLERMVEAGWEVN